MQSRMSRAKAVCNAAVIGCATMLGHATCGCCTPALYGVCYTTNHFAWRFVFLYVA